MSVAKEVEAVVEAIDVESVPPITHREWAGLAATEFERVIDLLRQLTPEEWKSPTVCDLWNVRQMVGHMLGMADDEIAMLHEVGALE